MSKGWFYVQNGQSIGPVPEEQLRAMLASGGISWDESVWCEGMASWAPARQVSALVPAPVPAPAPVPTPMPAPAPMPAYPQANPYAAPRAAMAPAAPMAAVAEGPVSQGTLEALRGTKPWVRLQGVLGAIALAFIVLFSLIALVAGLVGSSSSGPFSGMGAGMAVVVALVYLLMALVLLFPVIHLNRYASRISQLLRSGSATDLESALQAQRSFWRYIGVLSLIYLCLVVLGIIAAIAIPAIMALRH